tara:strand:+ start:1371 stop:1574 length:204 start_codon:yes stop_codon:yes gene_type:complete
MLSNYKLPCNASCNEQKKEVNTKSLLDYDCSVFDDQLMLCHVYKTNINLKKKTQKKRKNTKNKTKRS